jgi:hypothetical protein
MNIDLTQDPTQDVEVDVQPDEMTELDELRRGKFLRKIRFSWRREDQVIIEEIEGTAAAMVSEMFNEAITEIDRFYEALRTPVYRPGGRCRRSPGLED